MWPRFEIPMGGAIRTGLLYKEPQGLVLQEITERAKGTTSRLSERKSPKTPNAKRQIALEVGRTNRVTLMAENQEQHALQADKLPVPDG